MENEYAYPLNSPDGLESNPGMTLRDYFAGQFLASWRWSPQDFPKQVAKLAYAHADAMLLVRDKPEENT